MTPTNEAGHGLPELPEPDVKVFNEMAPFGAVITGYTADQMREMYQRGLAARPLPSDWVAVPREPTQGMVTAGSDHANNFDETRTRIIYAAMLAEAPNPPLPRDFQSDDVVRNGTAPETEADRACNESDGCPTEGAVLKRFWRSANTDDTKQLMAFYGVADVPALIEQQVQHVRVLQLKLREHEPKRDQFPRTPREG